MCCVQVALAVFLLLCFTHSRSQLILDDVAEDDEDLSQPQPPAHPEPTDPMTKLLQWGVDNTDKNSLAERAKAIREGRAQPQKLDMEVMDALFGGKVKFLQTCVKNMEEAVSLGDEEKIVEALHELEEEVTDIDNANDLDHESVGGLEPVMKLLTHSSSKVRAAALWVVGTTVQSNPKAQKLLISKKNQGHDVLQLILLPIRESADSKMAAADPKLLSKALYALSTLVRGCYEAQQAFTDIQGPRDLVKFAAAVAALPAGPDADAWLPVRRKVVALVGDMATERPDDEAASAVAQAGTLQAIKSGLGGGGRQDTPSAAASVLAMLGASDRELLEKALVTLLALLQGEETASAAGTILQGPAGASKIESTLKLARSHLARAGEDDDGASWEEVAVLAEKLVLAVRNATAVDGSAEV